MPSIDSLANLAYSTIESINGDGDGTSLDIVDEAYFPDPATNGAYNIVVKHDDGQPATVSNAEIMRVTAKSSATFTMTRDQESTTGITVEVGDIVFIAPTVANIKQSLHLEHISSVTLTDDATANFVLQNSVYKSYLFIWETVVPATDAQNFLMRTSTDGGSNYDSGASDYSWNFYEYTTALADFQDTADTAMVVSGAVGNASNEQCSGHLWLYGPGDAVFTRMHTIVVYENATTAQVMGYGTGKRLSAADVTAVQFLFSAGNITSGVIRCYGLKGD